MSLFSKIIASIGIGSAKVDTKISSERATQGEQLNGIIEIKGGYTDQEIDGIELCLMTRYIYDESDHPINYSIYTYKVSDRFVIDKGEVKEIPFSFQIPFCTPMTVTDPHTLKNIPRVWIDTNVSIHHAVHSRDYDPISIAPSAVYEAIIQIIEQLGFKRKHMKNVSAPKHFKTKHSYVQRFKFLPVHGEYVQKFDDLIVYILQEELETIVYFEVDKKINGVIGSIKDELKLEPDHEQIVLVNKDVIEKRDEVGNEFMAIINRFL